MLDSDSTSVDEEKNIGLKADPAGRHGLDNRISLSRTPIHLDEDQIFKAATDYECWKFFRYTLKDLPAFDNSASFGITVSDENVFIRSEIKKFLEFIGSEKPPLFNSHGAFGSTNSAGFEDLYHVIDQIKSNLQIIRYDNSCLALNRYFRQSYYEIFKESRALIRRSYQEEPRWIAGRKPTLLDNETRNTQAYHALIDFVLHSLAWWMMDVAERKSWHAPIIAVLVRWSVKLKFVALDPTRWATQGLAQGEDIMGRISSDQKDEDKISVELRDSNLTAEPKTPKTIYFPEDQDQDFAYYSYNTRLREVLLELVSRILDEMVAESVNVRRQPLTSFEVRTLMYKGGLDRTLRQLTVKRDGSIETSSDSSDLRSSYRAMQLLLSNSRRIVRNDVDSNSTEVAQINWHVKRTDSCSPDHGSITTERLDDVISALVPLGLMGGSRFVKSIDNPLFRDVPDDDYLPGILDLSSEESPRIEFSLSTKRRRNNTPNFPQSKMVSTSESPLIASMEDIAKELTESNANNTNSPILILKKDALKTYTDYETRKSEIKDWTITEEWVRVRTTKYSSVVLTIAVIIIGGSLSVPFLVGNRIEAVDPFNFATFGWLLAGAFLVGAKSRYVTDWPWHDFLRGQILCRTVSELATASRVKKQAVLLYLLHHEFRNPLVFRGPYHGAFSRRATSGNGFTIDVWIEHATLLAAGFIVIKVRPRECDVFNVHALLHDTRDDAPYYADGKAQISEPLEGTTVGKGEDQALGHKETVRLTSEVWSSDDYEILGLPISDCTFV